MRFCGARAQSSRKTALSKYTIKSEIPSLAHSTPHNSNRNGSSTASYTSSGGNYAVLSLKSPQFNNYRDSLIKSTLLFCCPCLSSHCLRPAIVHSWVGCWCLSGVLLPLWSLWRSVWTPSSISPPLLWLEETKARIRRRWQKARRCVGCACRCMCVSLYLSH